MPRQAADGSGGLPAAPPLTGFALAARERDLHRCDGQIMTTRVGLQFPTDVTFETWERAGFQLTRMVDSFAWCLGDWLVYGQRKYADRYRRAVDAVGLDYQTLRNYASVARRVDISRRRWKLSFQHHAEVASLPDYEQDEWLTRAEEAGWSRNQLRQYLRSNRRRRPAATASTILLPRVLVTNDRIERWRQAAALSSNDFESWMITVLDSAAKKQLGYEI